MFYKLGYLKAGSWSFEGPIQVLRPDVHFGIMAIYPNPATATVRVAYVARTGVRSLSVFDLQGHRVRELLLANSLSTSGVVLWDGKAEDQTRVAAGTYLVRLESKDMTAVRKLVVLH